MATKSFLKSLNIKGKKNLLDFARAIEKAEHTTTMTEHCASAYPVEPSRLDYVA